MTHGYATQARCFHVKYTHRYILYTYQAWDWVLPIKTEICLSSGAAVSLLGGFGGLLPQENFFNRYSLLQSGSITMHMYCTRKITFLKENTIYDISCKVHGISVPFHKAKFCQSQEHSQFISLFNIMITPFQGWGQVQLTKYSSTPSTPNIYQVQVLVKYSFF